MYEQQKENYFGKTVNIDSHTAIELKEFTQILENAPKDSEKLELKWMPLYKEHIDAVTCFLKTHNITAIDLQGIKIDRELFKEFMTFLKADGKVSRFAMKMSASFDDVLDDILKFAYNNQKLTALDLSFNGINSNMAYIIAEAISKCSNLQSLDLLANNIGTEGAKYIAKALAGKENLEKLQLSCNKIGTEGVSAIADLVPSLTYLDLSYNKGASISKIADTLASSKLKVLDLSGMDLPAIEITSLASALRRGAVEALDLSFNKIGNDGAYEIALLLEVNDHIKYLSLKNNEITEEGGRDLIKMLDQNDSLISLDISDNDFGSQLKPELEGAIKAHANLMYYNSMPTEHYYNLKEVVSLIIASGNTHIAPKQAEYVKAHLVQDYLNSDNSIINKILNEIDVSRELFEEYKIQFEKTLSEYELDGLRISDHSLSRISSDSAFDYGVQKDPASPMAVHEVHLYDSCEW